MNVVCAVAHSLSHDINKIRVSRSSTKRKRESNREINAQKIKDAFEGTSSLTIHWDGKLLKGLASAKKVEHLVV